MSIKDFFKSISELPIFKKMGDNITSDMGSNISNIPDHLSNNISSKIGNAPANFSSPEARDKYIKAYEKMKAKKTKKAGKSKGPKEDGVFDKKKYRLLFRKMERILTSNKRKLDDTNVILTIGEYSEGKRDLFADSELASFYMSSSTEPILNNPYVSWHIDRNAINFDLDKSLLSFDKVKSIKESDYGTVLKSIKSMGEHKTISAIILRIPITLFKSLGDSKKEVKKEKIKILAQQYYSLLNYTFNTFLYKIPVYVLLTEAEEIFGYNEFINILTPDEKEQFFGWSNPNEFELPYSDEVSREFADDFRNTMDNFIGQKMIENLEPEKIKNVLIFKNDLFTYMNELRSFIDFLFLNNKFYEYSGLRGVYLCGHENTETLSKPLGTDIHTSLFNSDEEDLELLKIKTEQANSQQEYKRLMFFRNLYAHKISKELNLNIPTKNLIRKNKNNKAVSLVLLFIVIFTLPFLYYNFDKNTREVSAQVYEAVRNLEEPIKATVAQDKVNQLNTQVNLTSLSAVYAELQNRKTSQLRTIFSPLTMFSNIDRRVNHFFYGSVVLFGVYPAYSLLQTQISSVQQIGASNTPNGVGESYNIFEAYLKNVNNIERDLTIYDVFTSVINVDQLNLLLQNLVGTNLADFFQKENIAFTNTYGFFRIRPINTNLLKPAFTSKYEILFNNLLRAISNDTIMKDISNNIISYVDYPSNNMPNGNNYLFLKTLFSNLEEVKKSLDFYSNSVQILTSAGVEVKLNSTNVVVSANNLIVRKPQVDIDKLLKQAVNRRNQGILSYISTTMGNLYAFKDQNSPPRLADKFTDLDTLLTNLQNTDFFNGNKLNQNSEQLTLIQSGFNWNKINLQRILAQIGSYEKYMNDNLKKFPPALQPIVKDAGISGMANMIVNEMNEDTIRGGQVLGDVEQETRIFNDNKDGITKVLKFLSASNQNELYKNLVTLTLEKSVYYLSYYTNQLNQSVHYRPKTNNFSWWDGANPPALTAYNVYGQTELDDYVGKQNTKVGNLLKDFTQPLVDLISSLVINTTYQQNQDYQIWSQVSKQYAEMTKNGTGSLQVLSDFILKTLSSVDVESCLDGFDAVDKENVIDNYFSRITKDIAASLQKQCEFIYENQIAIKYNKVVSVFNTKIAGNFPFVSAFAADTAPEIGVTELRDFISLFKSYFSDDSFLDKIKNFHVKNWVLPLVFLQRMMNISKFFWPLMGDSKNPPNNQFYVVVDFNRSKEDEINTNALLERRFYVASNYITNLALEQKAIWSPMESVSFDFHWAKDADVLPVALSSDNNAKFTEASKGYNISLTATDRWSLIYLIEKYSRTKDEYFYSPEIFFNVPLKRIINFKQNFIIANNNYAHIGLKIQFYNSNKSELLTVPVFPTDATPMKVDPLFTKNMGE